MGLKKPKIKIVCETCKKEFYVHPYRLKHNVKYCSLNCNPSVYKKGHIPAHPLAKGHPYGRRFKKGDKPVCPFKKGHPYGRRFKKGDTAGDKHWNWKGGIWHAKGYIYIRMKNHPNAIRFGYVRRSVLEIEKHLGHFLDKKCVVHHIDGNTTNDNINNLFVFPNQASHARFHKIENSLKQHKHN